MNDVSASIPAIVSRALSISVPPKREKIESMFYLQL
nr:MAG TPA: hypothetical protein [Caudoviricetes sp.]